MSDDALLWVSDGLLPGPIAKSLYREFGNIGGAAINGWTGVHFLSGMVLAMTPLDFFGAMLVHTVWEAFQAAIESTKLDTPFIDEFRAEIVDIVLDTIAFGLGFLLGRLFVGRR